MRKTNLIIVRGHETIFVKPQVELSNVRKLVTFGTLCHNIWKDCVEKNERLLKMSQRVFFFSFLDRLLFCRPYNPLMFFAISANKSCKLLRHVVTGAGAVGLPWQEFL